MKNKLCKLRITALIVMILLGIYFSISVNAAGWRSEIPDTSVWNIAWSHQNDDGYYYLGEISNVLVWLEDCEDAGGSSYTLDISTSSSDFLCVREDYSIVFYAKKAGLYKYTIKINDESVTASAVVIDMNDDDVNLVKGGSYQIAGGTSSGCLTFTTSDKSVAAVSASGKVTGKGVGTAEICAYRITDSEKKLIGYMYAYVSNPKISSKNVSINIYDAYKSGSYYYTGNNYVNITGLSDNSRVTVRSSSSNLKCEYYWNGGVYFYPKKTGTYTVTIDVDGKSFSVKVKVIKLYFKLNSKNIVQDSTKWNEDESCILLYKGDTAKLTLKGAASGSKVKYRSGNTKVAKVSSSGKITGKGVGKTDITATVDGNSITYNVEVSYRRAVLACRYAKKHYGSKYSQSKRMSSGYYDCSSWAWRSYKSAKVYVSSSKSWAPTAADMAKWCVNNGYMIYDASTSGTVDASKLLAGDLVFECGADNGRYKGIYHVDLYQGNYSTTSVNRMSCYYGELSGVMIARPCGTKNAKPAISSTSKRKVKLSWSASYKADGYQIYRSASKDGKYKRVATVKSGATTYIDTGLASKKIYYYKVRPYWKNSKGRKMYGRFSAVVSEKVK